MCTCTSVCTTLAATSFPLHRKEDISGFSVAFSWILICRFLLIGFVQEIWQILLYACLLILVAFSAENTPVILDIKTGIDLAQEMLHSYTTDYFYSSIVEGLLTTWVDLAVLQDRHARLLHAGGTCTIILKIKLCACTIP